MINPVNATNIGDVRRLLKKMQKSKNLVKADMAALAYLERYQGFYRIASGNDYDEDAEDLGRGLWFSREWYHLLPARGTGRIVQFLGKRLDLTHGMATHGNASTGFRLVRNR